MQTIGDALETFRTAEIDNDNLGHSDGLGNAAGNVMDGLGRTLTVSWVRRAPRLPTGYRVLPEWAWVTVRKTHGLGEHIADPVTLDKMATVLRGVRRQASGRYGVRSNAGGTRAGTVRVAL